MTARLPMVGLAEPAEPAESAAHTASQALEAVDRASATGDVTADTDMRAAAADTAPAAAVAASAPSAAPAPTPAPRAAKPAKKSARGKAPARRTAAQRALEVLVEPLPAGKARGEGVASATVADGTSGTGQGPREGEGAADGEGPGEGRGEGRREGDLSSRPGPARVGELLPVPLTEVDVERIGEYQRLNDVRFGQAAVALALATQADVDWALSQQVGYAWVRDGESAAASELVQARAPFGAAAEAFRDLRAHLMSQPELAGKALAVVSTRAGDGRSFVAANLAIAFSQFGANTLLVDADLRRPRQHRLFGLPGDGGLVGLLSGRQPRSVVRRVPQLPGLHLLPAGVPPPHPLELLQRPNLASLLADVSSAFDVVIVDTPPTEGLADARVVAAACGGALAVARKDHTSMAALHDLAATLARLRVHFAGVVFNPA